MQEVQFLWQPEVAPPPPSSLDTLGLRAHRRQPIQQVKIYRIKPRDHLVGVVALRGKGR